MSTEPKTNSFQSLKRKVRYFLNRNYPTVFFTPHMLKDEFNLFKKHTADSKNIIEYGAGGSTFFFLKNRKNLYTVENNLPFVELLKSMKYFNKMVSLGKIKFFYVDLGPTAGWGKPVDESNKENWILYASKVWDEIPAGVKIDTIFIDGRCRVLTGLYSILKTDKDAKFIIHDFWTRKQYHVLLDFLEPIETASQLIVCKKKEDIDLKKVEELIKVYRYEFA